MKNSYKKPSTENLSPQLQIDHINNFQVFEEKVKNALTKVQREHFVPKDLIPYAYQDSALAIGYGQTISQPFIVALMTQEAKIIPGMKVLEIGTGSGYQAAVLSELGAKVYSVEIIKELAISSKERLDKLGYSSIKLKQGDGYYGWKEYTPFDVIIVTAASPKVPEPLLEQLSENGKLIIPIEEPGKGEFLILFEKTKTCCLEQKNLGDVRFVPLVGEIRKG